MTKKHYQNIVVGGGLSGLSIAYWLKKNSPSSSVVIISDHNPSRSPASIKNAGFLTVGSLNFYLQNMKLNGKSFADEILSFCRDNHELLLAEGLLGRCKSYVRRGSFSLTSSEITHVPDSFSPAQVPLDQAKPGETAWYTALDGSVDPGELVKCLHEYTNVEILDAQVTALNERSVSIEDNHLSTDRVFLATNAWTTELVPELKIVPTRAQALMTKPLGKLKPVNYYFSNDLAYVRVTRDSRIVLGGMRSLDPDTEETDKHGLNTKIQKSLLELARTRFSDQVQVERQWSGIMGFSENHLPIAGVRSGVHYQAGFSGHGMGMAFLLAKCLVGRALLQTPLPEWSLTESSIEKLSDKL